MNDWRGYSVTELEAQYDNRAAVPEHGAIFRSWRARSAETRRRLTSRLGLRYGPEDRQVLDLFLPAERPARLHAFFHGGYWQAMDKDASSFVAVPLVEQGLGVAVVNYRLCPRVSVADVVADARAACLWLWHQAPSLGIDAARIQVSGHSAGGHLLAMLWATDWGLLDSGLPSTWLQSGISLSGLFELEPLVRTPVNRALGLNEEEARRMSPALLEPRTRAPLVLGVGALESAEYKRQSRRLAENWTARGVHVRLLHLEGRNHFTILDDLTDRNGPLLRWAVRLWEDPSD